MWGIELIGKQNVEVMIRKIVKPVLQSSRRTWCSLKIHYNE